MMGRFPFVPNPIVLFSLTATSAPTVKAKQMFPQRYDARYVVWLVKFGLTRKPDF